MNNDKNLIGKQLGDYTLTAMLGHGGMSTVYIGEDQKLGRRAAIKVMLSEFATDDSLVKRFEREARTVAQLEHDNIVPIYQFGEQDNLYFIAMKYIEGNDLADEIGKYRVKNELMPTELALNLLEQIAKGLDHAHQRGIIHRDVKPSNVLLQHFPKMDTTKAVLTDFGLVLWLDVDATMGTAFGTPRYISPEQAMNSQNAVPQSDIYSLAVMTYEILTDKILFEASTPMQVALSHITETPIPPRTHNSNIPQDAQKELLKALEKDPQQRHNTALEFIESLKTAYNIDHAPAVAIYRPIMFIPQAKSDHLQNRAEASPQNSDVFEDFKVAYPLQENSTEERSFLARIVEWINGFFSSKSTAIFHTQQLDTPSTANNTDTVEADHPELNGRSLKIFLSYSSKDRSKAMTLRNHLEAMGHTVWMDDKISSGMEWWREIIRQIQNCHVMVIALSAQYLQSSACQKEYTYASKWNKYLLPIQIEEINYLILPRTLVEIQITSLLHGEEHVLEEIANTLNNFTITSRPPTVPPTHPRAPLSELHLMAELAVQTKPLTSDEEREFLAAIKRALTKNDYEQEAAKQIITMRLTSKEFISQELAQEIQQLIGAS